MIRPPRLRPGDPVAVVAPAGPVPRDRFEAGARILAARYRLVYDDRIFDQDGFLAGPDLERLGELNRALGDPAVRAVICARGGYGLMRLLAQLDRAAFLRAPKPIIGFSDATALHAWAAGVGVVTVHGPVVTQLGELARNDQEALIDLLESPAPPSPVEGLRTLVGGEAGCVEGTLLGGNLELISRVVGSPYQLQLNGAVLLLEEVGERPYRIDRAITQLDLAGALTGLRAVVLGDLHNCHELKEPSPTAEQVVVERLQRLGVPILAGAPLGHGTRNRALPLGVKVRVDPARGTLMFLGSAVS